MHRVPRRLILLGVATLAATGGAVSTAVVGSTPAPVDAASPPWTLPTRPPVCSTEQRNSGDVGGCVITLGAGNPEDRGWPEPPFPNPVPGSPIPWVDLAKGATGPVVALVQGALNDNGADLEEDGQFGSLTESAVKSFQNGNSLAVTGVVNQATADLLGVQNTTFTWPPSGWNWLGWGYNGSVALHGWESLMRANTSPIGSVKTGQFRSLPDALPLFEGFLAEIQARGYVIYGGTGAYVFRCTASTRKDCAGLTKYSLSNHSYGLATDINVSQNPMKTYYGINGASACATPIQTDMPQWMVQTAEKWGLYWGGYGWSSGCLSPSQFKTSVSRDTMHFEFNGTPQQAQAILRFNLGADNCFDVADDAGVISERCLFSWETPAANTRSVIDTDAPNGATAALVNITTTSATANGWVTAESCGPISGPREWSNGNVRPGRTTAASTVVPIDSQGRFCLYQSGTMHTIVDVQGYFAPSGVAPNGNLFTPITPERSVDTRSRAYCTPEGECADSGPVPANTEVASIANAPVDAVATLANMTITAPSAAGYATADACADLVPGPQTRSNVNFGTGDTVTNLGVVPSVSTEQGVLSCITASAAAQMIIDVQGFYAPASEGGLGFTLQTPSRLVDTRQCWTDVSTGIERCNLRNGAGSILYLDAPDGATAVMVNLTTVQALAAGYVTAASCDTMVAGPQANSNVNAVVGAAVANTAVVPVAADGTFCIYVSSSMHLAIDLVGTYWGGGDLRLLPVTPVRVHDSRP
jgi:hypothetical protein